jgi:phosphatidylserine decarboxylase precursor
MKQLKLIFISIVLVCGLVNISCSSNSDNPTPVQPEQTYSAATRELIALVDGNPQLKSLLEKAIAKGVEINPDHKTNPVQTLSEYYDFVEWAAHAMPWTVINQPEGTDIFTRIDESLNYFFFINDIPLDELDGQSLYNNSLQYYEPYRSWLKTFAKAWGAYLDSEDSWNQTYYDIVAKEDTFGISKGWYEDASNWKTFNQFFARKLISPSVRPIASPQDNSVVVSPADACTQGVWQIDDEGYIVQVNKPGVQIKSKKYSSIAELVGPNSLYREAFNGGTLTHSFLNVYDYHRYHFPMSGKVKEVNIIDGDYAVGGTITWNKETKKYDLFCDTPGWQSIETRGCVILETPDYGVVALLPIGMMPVTSINWVSEVKVGAEVTKGQELGYFLFGGSDFVILFQKGISFELKPQPFTHQLMGEELGRLSTNMAAK